MKNYTLLLFSSLHQVVGTHSIKPRGGGDENLLQHPGCFFIHCLTMDVLLHCGRRKLPKNSASFWSQWREPWWAMAPPNSSIGAEVNAAGAGQSEESHDPPAMVKATVPFLLQADPQHLLQMWTAHFQSPHLQHLLLWRLGLNNMLIGTSVYHIHFVVSFFF